MESEIRKAGIRVHLDGRGEYTSGWKFNEWEMKGVPLRINLGPRDIEKGTVEFVRRDTKEKFQGDRGSLTSTIVQTLDAIQKNLYDTAARLLNENTSSPATYQEFRSIMQDKGGFAFAGWCGRRECEDKIKEETGADIRVIPFDQKEKPASCIYCGMPSEKVCAFARAY
jgi:prolyl-tRNA synthetase